MRFNQYLKGIFNNVEDSIIVLDKDYKIVTSNLAFSKTFSELIDIIDMDINDFFKSINFENSDKDLENILEKVYSDEPLPLDAEICAVGFYKKYYNININPILSKKGSILGKVLLFSDITGYKNLLQEMDEKNRSLSQVNQELFSANNQLQDYASLLNDLAIVRERNRLAEEVQSTAGNTLINLSSLLKECYKSISAQDDKVEHKLQEVLSAASNGLRDLRRAVRGISTFGTEIESLSQSLKRLVDEAENRVLHIDLSIDGNEDKIDKKCKNSVIIICSEAIKNTVCHSQAQNLNIIVKLKPDRIKLYIMDDGAGCEKICKGGGLNKIENSVTDLNGTVIYGSSVNNGFNIHIEIPLSP